MEKLRGQSQGAAGRARPGVLSPDESLRVDLEVGLLAHCHDYQEAYRRLHAEGLAGLAGLAARG